MPQAEKPLRRRVRELEAQVAQLLEESADLAERQSDATLLGLVSEHVYLEAEAGTILAVALEQVSVTKDLPFCAVATRAGAALVLRAAFHARSHRSFEGLLLQLTPRVDQALADGPVRLTGPECAEAGLDAAALDGLAPVAALLVPFTCRTVPEGLFVFATEAPEPPLGPITPLLQRVVEAVSARLENVALLRELVALTEALDGKVAERTRELTDANAGLEREVEERRRAVEALRASEDRLRLALAAASMTSLRWDLETGRFEWADGAAALLGALPCTLPALLDRIHPADRGSLAALLAAAPQSGRRTRLGVRMEGPPERWLEIHASGAQGGEGAAAEVTVLLHDATDRHVLEGELQQAQKLESLGRVTGGVAHDFNNLLTTILGVGELALAAAPAGGELAGDLRAILDAGRHAASLTRQLLAFSRKQRLEMRAVRLDEVCQAFTPLLRRLIGEEIEVRLELDPATPAILADRSQLEQVLMNLAVNARDAMPRGGVLTLRTGSDVVEPPGQEGLPAGSWTVLAVADTGVGMSPEVAVHAFEPFFTTKARGQGTGLGLATVYGVVRQHGGHVRIRSAPGRGTCFELHFPPLPPGAAAAAAVEFPAEPEPAVGGAETVLVVDDEPSIRRVVRTILGRLGYRVLEAGGADEALAVADAEAGRIDALITDVVMPGGRGTELGRAFQARWPGRPVLLMSGYSDGLEEELTAPETNFLMKPITPELLGRAVRRALDGPISAECRRVIRMSERGLQKS